MKLKISFGIGGVITKYPNEMRMLIDALSESDSVEVYIISDLTKEHPTQKLLQRNGIEIPVERILLADRAKYGEKCISKVVQDNNIDIHMDANPAYCDNTKGINFFLWPNTNIPYFSPDFKSKGFDRRNG